MSCRSIRRDGLVLLAVLVLPSGARAADEPGNVELGFVPFTLSRVSAGGESVTGLLVPASGSFFFTGDRGLYLQWFASRHFAVEPQVSFSGLFGEDDDFKALNLGLRACYLVSGPDRPSPYLYGGGGLLYLSFDDDDSQTNPTAGGGLGFRLPIRSAGSVRFEAGYEHIFGDAGEEGDIFKLSVGFALRF